MTVFSHQYYEISKGVRNLALLTASEEDARSAARWLQSKGMECFVQCFGSNRANLFFGRADCVEVARQLMRRKLNELTDEEDFMLGVLLGYDCREQCRRYLRRKTRGGGSPTQPLESSGAPSKETSEVFA